jgi:ERCC4-type nuclease
MKKPIHLLIQDTREQAPLSFYHPQVKVAVRKVECGDYGFRFADGTLSCVEFERKSVGDLYGSLTSGHDRFHRKISRAQDKGIRLVLLVENSMSKVQEGYWKSRCRARSY